MDEADGCPRKGILQYERVSRKKKNFKKNK